MESGAADGEASSLISIERAVTHYVPSDARVSVRANDRTVVPSIFQLR